MFAGVQRFPAVMWTPVRFRRFDDDICVTYANDQCDCGESRCKYQDGCWAYQYALCEVGLAGIGLPNPWRFA